MAQAKKVTKTIVREFLKYSFSHEEIHEKGLELARLSSEENSIDKERKAIASEFKAKLDGKAAQIEVIGTQINNGYEHRYIDCECHHHDPNTGMKTVYRKDNGEKVRVESMTPDELQIELELNEN